MTKICVTSVLACSVFIGCRPSPTSEHSHGPGADHEHELKTAQINAWTNGFEIFAEHQAPVADKPITFITHVSDLATGEPRREGPALFLLSQGETRLEHLETNPARSGIYLPTLTFPSIGSWGVEIVLTTAGKEAKLALGTVMVVADDHAAAHAEFPELPEGLSFLKEQQWKIPMVIEPVGDHPISEQVRLSAQVLPLPGSSISVPVLRPGVMLPPLNAAMPGIGDKVQAGQVLARVQLPFSELAVTLVEARSQTSRAKTALEQAEVTLERTKKLAEQQARSQRELQEAEFAFRAALASYNAARALETAFGDGTTSGGDAATTVLVTSPVAGTVAAIPSEHQSEFVIQQNTGLLLQAAVPQTQIDQFSGAVQVTVQPVGTTNLYTYPGAVLGPVLDAKTATLPLSLAIPNPPATLRAGSHAIVFAETKRVEQALAIPLRAIVDEHGNPTAYVQLSGETFEKRDLRLGIRDHQFAEVLSGLQRGERVVTTGAFAIRLAAASSTIPAHGHAH